jgi:hypothetical protein
VNHGDDLGGQPCSFASRRIAPRDVPKLAAISVVDASPVSHARLIAWMRRSSNRLPCGLRSLGIPDMPPCFAAPNAANYRPANTVFLCNLRFWPFINPDLPHGIVG